MSESTTAPAAVKPGVHLLPLNLGCLARHADRRDGNAKFSLNSVRVEFRGDTFVAEATDTKQLVRVEGLTVAPGTDFPDVPALVHAPNGATTALVPAAAWERAFKSAAGLKVHRCRGALQSVACVTGDHVTTFAAANMETSTGETAPNVAGKFPPVGSIIDGVREQQKGATVARFAVDAALLADVLKTAATFAGDGGNRVEFEVIVGEGGKPTVKPILMTAADRGHKLTALLQPLV